MPHQHRRGPEAGVTLIEGLLVVAIVGTLVAIAVPTFVDSHARQDDASAQQSLRSALTAADVAFAPHRTFIDANGATLRLATPTLDYVTGNVISIGSRSISIRPEADRWSAAAQSETGTCFFIAAHHDGRVRYGTSADGACSGDTARRGARHDSW
jgi:type II secretory pathway pseudopilin PulG